LLLSNSAPKTVQINIYSDALARRLGIFDEHLQRKLINTRSGAEQSVAGTDALVALRAELVRRGWT
jgi:hypothetical protein